MLAERHAGEDDARRGDHAPPRQALITEHDGRLRVEVDRTACDAPGLPHEFDAGRLRAAVAMVFAAESTVLEHLRSGHALPDRIDPHGRPL